ncbi:MAG: GNAT family N-acetyltransferase [Clostridium butyricum]|nr:GNAT family N-acetyltransferase [Clostridium butyricum]
MIFLSKMNKEDLQLIMKWKEDKIYLNTKHKLTTTFQKEWFYNIEKDDKCKYWMINSGFIKIGIANINHIDMEENSCCLECIIEDRHFRERGITQIVMFNLFEYAFDKINMNSIYITFEKNKRTLDTDEFMSTIVKDNKALFNKIIDIFDHKFICIKKEDWQLFSKKYLLEKIEID